MHRAEQIVVAVVAALDAAVGIAATNYLHRELSLSDEDQELPALCVRNGQDQPLSDLGAVNFAFIDSLLEVRVAAYAKGATEIDVATELARMRAVTHRALLGTDRTLGLSFVIDTRYGGADRPEFDSNVSRIGGMQESVFFVHYRMNIADPE